MAQAATTAWAAAQAGRPQQAAVGEEGADLQQAGEEEGEEEHPHRDRPARAAEAAEEADLPDQRPLCDLGEEKKKTKKKKKD